MNTQDLVNKKVVIGKNQFEITGLFSHHIGNAVFYKLTPTVINSQSELLALTSVNNQLWIEKNNLLKKLISRQAAIVENDVELEKVKG